jgi:hypothetical protein
MKLTNKITVAATGVALLAGASPAAAQLPGVNGYSAPAASIQTSVPPAPSHAPSPSVNTQVTPASSVQPAAQKVSGSQLPFTGLDVGLTLAAGGILLALGFGIRRLVRPSGT